MVTAILSPLAAMLVSILLVSPFVLDGTGFLGIIYLFALGPLLLLVASTAWLILVAKASGLRRLCHATAFSLLFPVPIAALARPTAVLIARHDVEDFIMWQFRSDDYRAPAAMTVGAGLPHTAWRRWGFLSVRTEAYLVFDEADSLASSAFRGGDVPGVPCGVWHVFPLQRQWYVVTLYSGQTWDVCG